MEEEVRDVCMEGVMELKYYSSHYPLCRLRTGMEVLQVQCTGQCPFPFCIFIPVCNVVAYTYI